MAITKINTKLIANNTIALTNIADNAIDATKIASNNILARHIPNATDMTLGGLTVDTTTLVVDATNNRVGIGTASPSALLTIDGGNSADDNTPKLVIEGANAILRLGDGQVSNGGPHGIQFDYQGTGVTSGMSMYYRTDPEYISFEDSDDNTGSKVMVITKTGHVGIGTESPSDELHLRGNNPAARFDDTDGGYGRVMGVSGAIYYQADEGANGASSFHRWDVAGTDNQMRLSTDGLSINDTTTDGSRFYVKVPDSDTVSSALKLSQNNAAGDDRNTLSIKCDGPNNLAVFNSSGTNNGGYAFNSGGTEKMRMSAAGRMILGHNASISNGVAAKLQIYNAGAEGSLSLGRWGAVTSPPYLTFMKSRGANVGDNTILNDNDIIGEIRWRAADGVNFNAEAGAIHCRVDGTPGADDMPGELHFQTTSVGSDTATSKMIIKPNGNVGIGTADAQTLLELSAHNAAGQNTLRFTDEDTGTVANQAIGKIEFYTSDGSGDGASVRAYILGAAQDATPSTYLAFATNAGGAGSGVDERMRIDKDGAVIINGTTTEVAGSCTWTIGSRNPVQCFNASAFVANMEFMTFRNQGTQIGSVTVPSGGSSTSFNTSSDYRLKENVTYTWNATTRLKQLKPARFNWIADDTNTLEDGFLAHEVQAVVPNAVTGTKDQTEDYVNDEGETQQRVLPQQMDHSKLVPLLTKALQEQQTIIDDLKSRITALES